MSGPLCKCCTHPDREAIDRAILEGTASLRSIAERYGMSCQAILRHRDAHIPPPAVAAAVQAATETATTHGTNLVQRADALFSEAREILDKAKASDELTACLGAIRESARCLELIAKMRGVIDTGVTVNLVLAPQWITVQTSILRALADHPAARTAVLEALAKVR